MKEFIKRNKKIVKKLKYRDLGILKLGVFAFALALAQWWPAIIMKVDNSVWTVIFVVCWLWLLYVVFAKEPKKKKKK